MAVGEEIRSITTYAFGPFRLMPERQSLFRGETIVTLGGRALDILQALVERPGEIVSKRELIARAWPATHIAESNLKVNINALRRALGEAPDAPRYIATIVGRGYRFIAPVEAFGANPPNAGFDPDPVPRHNLPTATTRLHGRAEVMAAVREDIVRSRLVSITGPGGAGKTTLALAVAEDLVASFEDGVWLVDLARLRDPLLVADAVASAVGLSTHARDRIAALQSHLKHRRMLLVLDNCEHLIEAAAEAAEQIVAGTSAVSILTTAREPLRLMGERVRRLSGLEVPPKDKALTAAESMAFAAVHLFVDRASDRVDTFILSDAEAPAAAEICRRLDGLPLAIELAAPHVEAFGVRALLRHLERQLNLPHDPRGGPQRHKTLAAIVEWSFLLLPERICGVLRRLAVFAGRFDLTDALAVASSHAADPHQSMDDIAELVAKSLLSTEVHGDGISYRLLHTTRAYCIETWQDEEERRATYQRHSSHICSVLERAADEWTALRPRDWAQRYGHVLDDLRVALDWLGEPSGDKSLLIRLTVAGCLLWNHLSLTGECRERVLRAIDELPGAGQLGSVAEMKLQMSLAGTTLFTRGAIPQAMEALQRVLPIAERVGDIDHQLRCLRAIGSYELFRGRPETKRGALRRFVAIAEVEDPAALAAGDGHLALSEMFIGNLATARQLLRRHFRQDLAETFDPRFARFVFDQNVDLGIVLSHVEWLGGFPDTALRISADMIGLAKRMGHGLSLSNALAWACLTYLMARRYDECAACVDALDEQVVQQGIVIWRPVATFCRGAVTSAAGSHPAGLAIIEAAMTEFAEIAHFVRMPFYLGLQAEAYARAGRLSRSETIVNAALECAQRQTENWIKPELLRIKAQVLVQCGRAAEAEACLAAALVEAHWFGALTLALRAANDLADVWRSQSRNQDVVAMLGPIVESFSEGFSTPDFQHAVTLLGLSPKAFPPGP